MTDLAKKKCTPCQGGVPRLSAPEVEKLLDLVPGWSLTCNHTKIERTWKFENFVEAFAFAEKVKDLAESEWHHPDLTISWGAVQVVFYTHKIRGLHENDFIVAAKLNQLDHEG